MSQALARKERASEIPYTATQPYSATLLPSLNGHDSKFSQNGKPLPEFPFIPRVTYNAQINEWLAWEAGVSIRSRRKDYPTGTPHNVVQWVEGVDKEGSPIDAVLKYNILSPETVGREIDALKQYDEIGYGALKPRIIDESRELGVYLYRHINGENLRNLVRNGISFNEAVRILGFVVDIKKASFKEQYESGRYNDLPVGQTLQRVQRPGIIPQLQLEKDISKNVPTALSTGSDEISPADFYYSDLEVNGKLLPSLYAMTEYTNWRIQQEPQRKVKAHGDGIGANIMVAEDGRIYLPDPGYLDVTDVSDSLGRMFRWRIPEFLIYLNFTERPHKKNGRIRMAFEAGMNDVADSLHQQGSQWTQEFADELGDPGLIQRKDIYEAGSDLWAAALLLDENRQQRIAQGIDFRDAMLWSIIQAGMKFEKHGVVALEQESVMVRRGR